MRNLDPSDCTIGASSDIKQRATEVMRESQHVDPDWEQEPFYLNKYPFEYPDSPNMKPEMSMWKVRDEDLSTLKNAADGDGQAWLQRHQPILDYGAPNLLNASWEETAVMNITHTGGQAGPSNEWQSMSQVHFLLSTLL